MFTDKAKIHIKAGKGGDGSMSFHREKYVASGGPDGGDGGNGGSIYLVADNNISTLLEFKYKKKFVAPNGADGSAMRCKGKSGEDLYIKVPMGTVVKREGRVIADLREKGDEFLAAKGGSGGWGNCHFATATRQAPKFAKLGLEGEEKDLELEMRLLADVGLIGFPNVGKSTLLSVISDAKPKIANYHFTTLIPNLGVVNAGEHSFVAADIPGLIEGASEGVGLGHEFLRHIERTRLLIHVVDVSGIEGRNPIEDYEIINKELKNYTTDLSDRPQIVAANKTDIITNPESYEEFKKYLEEKEIKLFEISAATATGVRELVMYADSVLQTIPMPEIVIEGEEQIEVYKFENEDEFTVRNDNGVYVVEGPYVPKLIGSINFEDYESLSYFQDMLRKKGIIKALEEKGINEGDIVRMLDIEFEFIY